MGDNPLDQFISPNKNEKRSVESKTDSQTNRKERFSIQISKSVLERARNAVFWVRELTLAQLTQQALEKELKRLEEGSGVFDAKTGKPIKKKGAPFPQRQEALKSGRPLKMDV